jgi:hypothetical protein
MYIAPGQDVSPQIPPPEVIENAELPEGHRALSSGADPIDNTDWLTGRWGELWKCIR